MSDELADKLDWCCQWTLNDFGKQYAAEPPFYQMPHLVSVWRLIHLLAMRSVIAMRAGSEADVAGSSTNKPAPSYVLLQFYVGAVNRLVCAVQDAAVKEPEAKGKLTLRDTLTGAPLRLGSWKKPDFGPAVEWFDAIKKRDMVLVYDLLFEWRCDGIHFNEAVTVILSEFIQWAESEGVCPPGELARLLADIVPSVETEASAFADPSNAPTVSDDAGTLQEMNVGTPAGLSTPDIAAAFAGIGWSEDRWRDNLADGPAWVLAARRQKGRRGKGVPLCLSSSISGGFGLVNGAVAQHGEQHVAATPRQRDERLIVTFALLDLAGVVRP